MSRILLVIALLSGQVFLVCLVQNSCSMTYSFVMAYPNGHQMLSPTQLLLREVRSNPWFGVSLLSQLVFAVSLAAMAILYLSEKLRLSQQDAM